MEFDSLHSYLEARFSKMDTVTPSMIKQAKAEYRKSYLTKYYKEYNQKRIQISFRVSQKQYKQLKKNARLNEVKVTSFVKNMVLKDNNGRTQKQLSQLRLLVLKAIDAVEETVEENKEMPANTILHTLLKLQNKLQ